MQLLKKYSKLNIQILPFKGAGDLKTAVVSGTVQMFYGGTVAKQMVTDGAKCLASSKKDNWAKAPFIGSLITQANFPETSLQAIAFSNNQLSPKIATALRDAVNSNDFAEQLVTMGLTPASVSQRFTQDKAQTALRKLDELYKTIE
jgi:tripartite-type tricarboxylate transporter receptor subunit TctC